MQVTLKAYCACAQMDEEDDGRSRAQGARTARGSTWNHTKVFSEGGSEGAPTRAGRALSKRSGSAAGQRGQLRPGQSVKQVQSCPANPEQSLDPSKCLL